MPPTPHLRLKKEFDYMRTDGKKIVTPSMLFIHAPKLDSQVRCGVICSKKFSPLAVKRNRARRLLYESFRLLNDKLDDSAWILLIPRFAISEKKCPEVLKEMQFAAQKAQLLKTID